MKNLDYREADDYTRQHILYQKGRFTIRWNYFRPPYQDWGIKFYNFRIYYALCFYWGKGVTVFDLVKRVK